MVQEVGIADSSFLEPLTEDAFVTNLCLRFKHDQIYVSTFVLHLICLHSFLMFSKDD